MMRVFLRRAEEKQNTDPDVKVWVNQVKVLAYDIEDCIDEFALHLSLDLRHGASSLGSLRARRRIAADIQSIKSSVKEVNERRLRYGIVDRIVDKASSTSHDDVMAQYDPRSAALFVEDSQLVGINGPREKLVKWLLDDRSDLNLMAVVGAGGLGKTTVVKRAVESPKITGGHFHCRAWVTVSQVYRIEVLLRDMIKQLFASTPEDLEKMGRVRLIEKLRGHLENKRYVIVLDDIWTVDAWKSLEVALPRNSIRSRIIITTRIDEVAGACHADIPGDIHVQEKLSEVQSRELFCKRVFPEQTCPEELKTLSKSFLEKCDGLPLAIVAIAAALASKPKKTSEVWMDMLEHLSSELENNPNLQGVMQVLNFSYIDLPYHVKQCFLYLSKFSEDCLIGCNRIKRLWIAEGLVCGQRIRTTEEVAESYLNVLISRRLILPLTFNVIGKLKKFTLHDMMREMIVSRSTEENFVTPLEKNNMWLPQGVIRRLSINVDCVPEKLSLPYSRSLTMSGDGKPSLILSDSPAFRLLRVLDFEGCIHLQNHHLKVVCHLLHLKYLSLRRCKNVSMLPDSIGNLQNLETLDFRGCYLDTMPAKIRKLKRLCFLCGDFFSVPTKIRNLRGIQELGFVWLKRGMAKELQYLDQLKKLRVDMKDFSGNDGSDFCHFLEMETNSLRSLFVSTYGSLTFLKDVSSPPVTLEKLGLRGNLGTLPKWISSLRNLHKITLVETDLGADAIQVLGALPSLLQLDLHCMSYCEEKLAFSADQGFQSLKVLNCLGIELRSLIFEEGALPCIESVGMFRFNTGEMLGLENLTCLKTVEIRGMGAEHQAMVKQAVDAHPNHPKLILQ